MSTKLVLFPTRQIVTAGSRIQGRDGQEGEDFPAFPPVSLRIDTAPTSGAVAKEACSIPVLSKTTARLLFTARHTGATLSFQSGIEDVLDGGEHDGLPNKGGTFRLRSNRCVRSLTPTNPGILTPNLAPPARRQSSVRLPGSWINIPARGRSCKTCHGAVLMCSCERPGTRDTGLTQVPAGI